MCVCACAWVCVYVWQVITVSCMEVTRLNKFCKRRNSKDVLSSLQEHHGKQGDTEKKNDALLMRNIFVGTIKVKGEFSTCEVRSFILFMCLHKREINH